LCQPKRNFTRILKIEAIHFEKADTNTQIK
jgi:hypothetical protein